MYKKVLVPLDGSELSEHALGHLDGIATEPGITSIVLMRVAETPGSLTAGGYFSHEIPAEAKEQAKVDAHNYLTKIAKDLGKKSLDIKTVVTDGIPADDILNYAAENGVDLIVMSTHGRSGLSRWFSGSVAEKVIRHSTVPVLICPPHGCRSGRRD
jgi:nucleotide-binding universal stress UspA family protein